MTESSRSLTVAHQQPGECGYCDDRHERIVVAVAHELAERIRAEAEHMGADEYGSYQNVFDAADLIDPKANR